MWFSFSHVAYLLVVLLWICCCEATPFPFRTSAEGSGDDDLESLIFIPHTTRRPVHAAPPHFTHSPSHTAPPYITKSSVHAAPPDTTHSSTHKIPSYTTHSTANVAPPYTTHGPVAPPPTAISNGSDVELRLLQQVAGFLQDNLLLVIMVCSLVAFIIFVICCASFMSHKRKVNAYYPSSFPATKYVDETDKSGGARTFSEVPERPANSPQPEPVDSAKQLQEDILTAARKLRTPTKTMSGGRDGGDLKQKPPEEPKNQLDAPQSEETPAETVEEMISTEAEQKVVSAEAEQEVTPTPSVQETDQPKDKEPDQGLSLDPCHLEEEEPLQQEAPSEPEEPEPQPEVRSPPADSQEVASPIVRMIGGETTAF
ncbi:transmembrane protein 119-like [Megalops cyprinoides]|uniref:transmembrane protein 119-like n=1 Tax=Megalops cyprinoides TaxID=118141 RepID=UPI001863A6CE|nr:transmembrane protein 119-like [Megalops cyprinoides]XP_036385469.1 transmembrane protein 119-like [Megalops cyprinoides]